MGSTSDFAKRQLERMGWKEGNGLGKERQGRATPIIVQRRSDATGGLGIEQEKVRVVQHTIQNEWWKDTLGDTLAKLSDKKKKKKRKHDDTNGAEPNTVIRKTTYTDEELFIATGGARFGMRAGKTRNQAKWRRTEELENSKLQLNLHQQVVKVDNSNIERQTTTVPISDININQPTIVALPIGTINLPMLSDGSSVLDFETNGEESKSKRKKKERKKRTKNKDKE
jgi:G-patch domain